MNPLSVTKKKGVKNENWSKTKEVQLYSTHGVSFVVLDVCIDVYS